MNNHALWILILISLPVVACSTGSPERADPAASKYRSSTISKSSDRDSGAETNRSRVSSRDATADAATDEAQDVSSWSSLIEQAYKNKEGVELEAQPLQCVDSPRSGSERYVVVGPATPFYNSPQDSEPVFIDDSVMAKLTVAPITDYVEWRVVSQHDDWLEVESLGMHGYGSRCYPEPPGVLMLRIRAWVKRTDLELVVTTETTLSVDGGELVLAPGQVVVRFKETTYIPSHLGILKTDKALPSENIGESYVRRSDARHPPFQDVVGLHYFKAGTYSRDILVLGDAPVEPYATTMARVEGEGDQVRATIAAACLKARFEAPASVFEENDGFMIRNEGLSIGPRSGEGKRVELAPGTKLYWRDGKRAGEVGCKTSIYGDPIERDGLFCYPWQYPLGTAQDDVESIFDLCVKPSKEDTQSR